MKLSYAISDGEGTLIEYGTIKCGERGQDVLYFEKLAEKGTSVIIGPYDGTGE